MRYLVNLVYDPEFRGYVADVPELPGCMSQGKTVEDALENAREAIRAYLKVAKTNGHKRQVALLTAQVEA